MVGRPSRIAGSGRESIPKGQEWSKGPPGSSKEVGSPVGGPGVVESSCRRAGIGWEALLEGRKW